MTCTAFIIKHYLAMLHTPNNKVYGQFYLWTSCSVSKGFKSLFDALLFYISIKRL